MRTWHVRLSTGTTETVLAEVSYVRPDGTLTLFNRRRPNANWGDSIAHFPAGQWAHVNSIGAA